MRTRWLKTGLRIGAGLGKVAVVIGAAYALYGIALPWSQAKLFGALPVALPGYFYALGGVALTGALCSILLLRFPLAMTVCGIAVLFAAGQARVQIPHAVRGQLLGAQVAFAPLNRLLDQFHIANVTVGDYGARDDALLGAGVDQTRLGGWLILAGSLIALPADPLVHAARHQFGKQRCRSCGATWPLRRAARHCPVCGISSESGSGVCAKCSEPTEPSDRFCVRCGNSVTFHRDS